MAAQHWLVKQEPGSYPWSQLVQDGATAWTGVRNYQARNHLRSMKKGDLVLYYHSGEEKRAVGLARVEREAYADPTADEGDWSAVDLRPVRPLGHPVELGAMKRDPKLKDLALFKNTRLSVTPVTPGQYDQILKLSGTSL